MSMGHADQVVQASAVEPDADDWYLPPGATEPVRRRKPAKPAEPASQPEAESEIHSVSEPTETESAADVEEEPKPEPELKIEASPRRGRPRKG